ncbi:hypothetical protein EYF80_031604 [Liparis tanakae]|uniref:Uncharacterized protein n=1 Tax=Liparis tanakae TaxID=230148 RepID=A0A4Z2GXY2_9TELE|nr:hypothetical protein EYF80_031604 [Liparis tanakae]
MEFGAGGRQTGEADVYFSCHKDALTAMSRDRMFIDLTCSSSCCDLEDLRSSRAKQALHTVSGRMEDGSGSSLDTQRSQKTPPQFLHCF